MVDSDMERKIKETLDKAFRKGSAARRVAEIMVDGRPHNRTELAELANTAPTQIPRVHNILKKYDVPVDVDLGEDGRSSVFQLRAGSPSSRNGAKEAAQGSTIGRITSVWLRADCVEVETASGSYVFTFLEGGKLGVKTPEQEITIV